MQKIPTIFERDWNGDRSRVIDKPNPACDWVFRGEGCATRRMAKIKLRDFGLKRIAQWSED
jgi:hypothetical protein